MGRMLKELRRSRRAATSLELALISPFLILIILMIIENSLMLFAQSVLDAATVEAARQIEIGNITTSSAFRTAICSYTSTLFTCSNLQFYVASSSLLSLQCKVRSATERFSCRYSRPGSAAPTSSPKSPTTEPMSPLADQPRQHQLDAPVDGRVPERAVLMRMSGGIFRHAAHCLRLDRRGTAAVETALLSPVLILMFLGTVEVTQLIRVEAKLTRAAQAIQDIVAGQSGATAASLAIAFTGGQIVMTPFGAANLSAAVASVTFTSTGTAKAISWQQVENSGTSMTTTYACGAAAGMSLDSDSVIVVQATYTYVPIVSYILGKSFTLTQTAYGRPRNTPEITWSGSFNGTTGNC